MRAYVTGGTGYIGAQVIRKLLAKGYEVNALYRNAKPPFEQKGLQWMPASLEEIGSLQESMRGCEEVYHLAALARLWHPEKNAFFTINVQGTENIMQAAMEAGVRKMVFTSTAAVYDYSLNRMVAESDPPPATFEDEYARTKFLAEQKVIEASQKGFDVVIVQPPRVYGPGDSPGGTNPINKLVQDFLNRSFYFVPDRGQYAGNYAYMEDLVEGHLLAMQHGRSGERYILGGENHDYISLYTILEHITGMRRMRIGVNKRIMDIAAVAAVSVAGLFGKHTHLSPSVIRKIYSDRLLSCDKAVKELGYKITPFYEGLERTVMSMRDK
jgi:nucleoside-diphosphate-sugar epimerase